MAANGEALLASKALVQALPTLLSSSRRTRPVVVVDDVSCSIGEDGCATAADDKLEAVYKTKVIRVRNTFIETSECRSASLERFYQEREVHTCPGHRVGRIQDSLHRATVTERAEAEQETYAFGESPCPSPAFYWDRCFTRAEPTSRPQLGLLTSTMPGGMPVTVGIAEHYGQELPGQPLHCAHSLAYYHTVAAHQAQPVPLRMPDVSARGRLSSVPAVVPAVADAVDSVPERPVARTKAAASILGLVEENPRPAARPYDIATATLPPSADAAGGLPAAPAVEAHPSVTLVPAPPPGPAPGSAALPSLGSVAHGTGGCRPCAFFHGVGCDNGAICSFCHLCEAGERIRRRKERGESKKGGARRQAY